MYLTIPSPLRLEPTITFARALVRAMRDSTDTDALLTGEEITSIGRMARLVPLLEATAEGRALLADRPQLTSATTDLADLARLPPGTLGREYADHVARCGLDIDALTTPVTRGATLEANWLLERVRQTHDLWHTLLGLGTAPHEEVLVHAFQWPQLRMPYSALVVGFGTLKHLVPERRWPLLHRKLPAALAAGQDARALIAVYWERHWETPLTDLRARLRVRPASAW